MIRLSVSAFFIGLGVASLGLSVAIGRTGDWRSAGVLAFVASAWGFISGCVTTAPVRR